MRTLIIVLYITDKATRKKYVDDAIAFVGLEDFVKFHPKKLSGGLLRRLNIACGIAHASSYLTYLDEPTASLSPTVQKQDTGGHFTAQP